MKVHMVKISRGMFGGGILRGSLCGRLNVQSQDGMNVTAKPREVTCSFCRRYNLKDAAGDARRAEMALQQDTSSGEHSNDR